MLLRHIVNRMFSTGRVIGVKDAGCIRHLCPLEERYERYNRTGTGTLTTNTLIFLEAKAEVNGDMGLEVLKYLVQRYPVLKWKIKQRGERYYFHEIDKPKIDFTVDDTGDWQAALETSSTRSFVSENGPLWRSTLFEHITRPNFDKQHFSHQYGFSLHFNHAIIDGYSVIILFHELQQCLNALLQGRSLSCMGKVLETPAPLIAMADYAKPFQVSVQEKLVDHGLPVPEPMKAGGDFSSPTAEKCNLYTQHVPLPEGGKFCSSVRYASEYVISRKVIF